MKPVNKVLRGLLIIVLLFPVTGRSQSIESKRDTFERMILKKDTINTDQIRKFTTIDSAYFLANSFFVGDTVRNAGEDKLIIISYEDGIVCSRELLLLYSKNSAVNIDFLIGAEDCDSDASSPYHLQTYSIEGGKVHIKQQYFAPGEDDKPLKEEHETYVIRNAIFQKQPQ